MSTDRPYILDSDVFIAAKNSYYAFAICPGFWDSLIHHYGAGDVRSIDRVRGELLAGRKTEDLVQWVKEQLPPAFFLDTDDEAVVDAYGQVMLWVQRSAQYFDQAKAKFATEADGWLAAYAMVHGVTVVTNEQPRPQSRNRVLLPDVCAQFNVTYKDTFAMLHELAVRYEWRGAT
jgi:predicted nucleic acid-binding protein